MAVCVHIGKFDHISVLTGTMSLYSSMLALCMCSDVWEGCKGLSCQYIHTTRVIVYRNSI